MADNMVALGLIDENNFMSVAKLLEPRNREKFIETLLNKEEAKDIVPDLVDELVRMEENGELESYNSVGEALKEMTENAPSDIQGAISEYRSASATDLATTNVTTIGEAMQNTAEGFLEALLEDAGEDIDDFILFNDDGAISQSVINALGGPDEMADNMVALGLIDAHNFMAVGELLPPEDREEFVEALLNNDDAEDVVPDAIDALIRMDQSETLSYDSVGEALEDTAQNAPQNMKEAITEYLNELDGDGVSLSEVEAVTEALEVENDNDDDDDKVSSPEELSRILADLLAGEYTDTESLEEQGLINDDGLFTKDALDLLKGSQNNIADNVIANGHGNLTGVGNLMAYMPQDTQEDFIENLLINENLENPEALMPLLIGQILILNSNGELSGSPGGFIDDLANNMPYHIKEALAEYLSDISGENISVADLDDDDLLDEVFEDDSEKMIENWNDAVEDATGINILEQTVADASGTLIGDNAPMVSSGLSNNGYPAIDMGPFEQFDAVALTNQANAQNMALIQNWQGQASALTGLNLI